MFEDVVQMEKELEKFRKNILASSELVEGITDLTEATRKHKESYLAETKELLKKIDLCIDSVKLEHEATLNDLGKSIDLAISELQIKSAEELSVRVEQIDKIKDSLEKYQTQVTKKADEQIQQLTKECKSLSLEMKSELSTQESAYAEKLGQMQQVIKEYQIVVEEKYDGFIKRLESTDVDRIFTEIQNINQSIQTKFMILMGGIGIAIIISLIGLISK